jgi:multiple sugar transport system ATP-binding protein
VTTVKIENLRKKFGKTIAVEELSLEVKDKEVICLLGPSGCGKSTTLNCIAGLESLTQGTIYFDDVPVNHMPPRQRGIGLVFQSYALFHHMTARENLAFPLSIRKVPEKKALTDVETMAKFLNVEQCLDKKAGKLSLNERQRIAIGRTLLSNPKILLLDEPLSAIDAVIRAQMRGELKKLIRDTGQTTIYVTHDQLEALALADRIAVMSRGLLQQYGTPDDIYTHPKNRFVANFIGSPSMNFLECSLQTRGGRLLLCHEGFEYDISSYQQNITKKGPGNQVILGVRPENILVGKGGLKDGIKTNVDVVEHLGSETLINLKIGNDFITVNRPGVLKVSPGDSILIQFDQSKIHLFEKESETAIA